MKQTLNKFLLNGSTGAVRHALFVLVLLCNGCGKTPVDYSAIDNQFLSKLDPAAPLQSTLKEKMRKTFEFHTMLVPYNWKVGTDAISLYNDVDIWVIPKPGRCHQLEEIVAKISDGAIPGTVPLSVRRAFVAGSEGVVLASESTEAATKEPIVTKLYVANLNYDVSHDHMTTIIIKVQVIEENLTELEPLIDEMVNSVVLTL